MEGYCTNLAAEVQWKACMSRTPNWTIYIFSDAGVSLRLMGQTMPRGHSTRLDHAIVHFFVFVGYVALGSWYLTIPIPTLPRNSVERCHWHAMLLSVICCQC